MNEPFEAAVERHGATVLRVCRAVLGPGGDADDAWQETFLAALRAWPDLEEVTSIEAWLVTVAYRKSIDLVRAAGRRPTADVDLAAIPGSAGRPGEGFLLWEAVAALPERQRLAVACHYLGGLPHAETAALIGGTPAAARKASADGVAALRRRLSAADYLEPA